MLILENRINGFLIGCAYVSNELQVDKENFSYHIEYHRFNQKPNILYFDLIHNRKEGAEKLALLVYEEVSKKLKRGRKK
jgi:hypothetical protein